MQIIVPMSGFGERFRRAGYTVPKPLIEVDGKPIIAHVVDLFPGESDFLFICNQDHLDEPAYRMAEQIRRYCPNGQIVGIPPHSEGPVGALLRAQDRVKTDRPVFVNYCDFSCYWDWADFRRFVTETGCEGAIPAYRGFHPHSLGSTYYAYLKESGGWLLDIQEKAPFTDEPLTEFASSGGYYFASGALCIDACRAAFEQDLKTGGEYYVSLAYKVLAQQQRPVAVYELQHFMQWGTPADLEEYRGWSSLFRRLATDDARRARQAGSVLVPMAGYGKRFADAGYELPKPLIQVSGRPMVIQATRDLPDTPSTRFVLRRDTSLLDEIIRKLRTSFVGVSALVLEEGTDGQAITCRRGVPGLDADAPLTIGACDNAMLYDPARFEDLMEGEGPDLLVWIARGHADAQRRPEMFGWVDADRQGRVTGVRVKQAPEDARTAPMIVGAFTFRRAGDFERSCARLVERNGRVNGEFYVDSLVEDALALGLDCQIFEIDHYIGWGTPNDLKTFEYWQSCFHKWGSHPYRLEKDRRIPPSQVPTLAERYRPRASARTAEIGKNASSKARGGALTELLRFIPVGVGAVAIDFVVYMSLCYAGLAPAPAKTASFIAGALFAFAGNRYFTFQKRAGLWGFLVFWLVYLVSLFLNVAVNAGSLGIGGFFGLPHPIAVLAAFIAATGASATTNFVGMKWLVFKQSSSELKASPV